METKHPKNSAVQPQIQIATQQTSAEQLISVASTENCNIYELPGSDSVRRLIATTSETRAICNDPLLLGIDYTEKLELACAHTLTALGDPSVLHLSESTTTVLHILRGGLNFGLRQSLARAYGWNKHASAFISAQRARQSENPEDWYITENAYQKVFLPNDAAVVFGDVVATGTSLSYALHQMINIGETEKKRVSSFVFFTIGGPRSEEILAEIDSLCRTRFPNYSGSTVIYFEGRFAVAEAGTPLSIKYTGTDLIRRDCIMAPEFINSQYENPLFPLERCTIYDAGSRAFWVPEYIEDVLDYWEKTAMLARDGFTFRRLLQERCPDLDPDRFPNCSLLDLCHQQIEQCKRVLTCAE